MYLANNQQSYGTKFLHDYTQSQWKEYYFKKLWLYIFYLKNCVCVCAYVCTWAHVWLEVKGQLVRITFLPSYRSQGSKSGPHVGCKHAYWLSHLNGLILQIIQMQSCWRILALCEIQAPPSLLQELLRQWYSEGVRRTMPSLWQLPPEQHQHQYSLLPQ